MILEKTLEEQIVEKLKQKNWKITTAESCTGGLIAGTLVNVAGVSDVFKEGYITYADEAKQKLLGVEKEALERFGAVSPQVAEQMAKGAAKAALAEVAIAVTGVAGPDGGTPLKPVGLVYIGCVIPGRVIVTENHFKGTRREIREMTVETAFRQLLEAL